jgi:hypothetical protein
VTDIFNEVDEEVRREQFKKLWDRYGIVLIIAAVLIVVGVGGWRGYQWWQATESAKSGAAYDAAAELDEQGKRAEAEAAFLKVAGDGTSGYRTLAKLRAAADKSDAKEAVAAYDAITKDASVGKIFQELAAVRAGMLLVDTAPLAEMTQRLEPLTLAKGTFRHTARELLALAAVRANDATAAKRWFDEVQGDPETPQGVRQRVDMLMSLSEGAKG